MDDPIRLGLLLDSWTIETWKFRLVQKLLCLDFLNLISVEVRGKKKKHNSILSLHRKIDKKIFKPSVDPMEMQDGRALLKGFSQSEEDELEVLIYLGDDEVDESYLDKASFGLWSMIHFNKDSGPIPMPGYREILRKDPHAVSAILVRDKGNPKGRIIQKSWSRIDAKSITRTQEMIYAKSISLIPRSLEALHEQKALPIEIDNSDIPNGKIKTHPFLLGINGVKHGGRIAKELFQKATGRGQWFLMYSFENSLWNNGMEFLPIFPPKDAFWADPFVVERKNHFYIFFEELPYATNKGHISCMRLNMESGEPEESFVVLKKDYHLSYPFIFEYERDLYMIPESCENRSIELYRCKNFPGEWEHLGNLMEDVDAVDTTLFFHQGYWWMFSSIAEHAGALHDDELSLFYADSPLSKTWTPHPANPIVSDVRKARMAGKVFRHEGKIYRPAQDCSGLYGRAFSFYEIEELNPETYRERLVQNIEADWNPKFTRTHTFNREGGLKVIDSYRRISR
ncbi:MAG: hypothetical protein AAFR87_12325 [Bacteroidota bacterium]